MVKIRVADRSSKPPKPPRQMHPYFVEAIAKAKDTLGLSIYRSQAERYAAYVAERHAAKLQSVEPDKWIIGYEDPKQIPPEEQKRTEATEAATQSEATKTIRVILKRG